MRSSSYLSWEKSGSIISVQNNFVNPSVYVQDNSDSKSSYRAQQDSRIEYVNHVVMDTVDCIRWCAGLCSSARYSTGIRLYRESMASGNEKHVS